MRPLYATGSTHHRRLARRRALLTAPLPHRPDDRPHHPRPPRPCGARSSGTRPRRFRPAGIPVCRGRPRCSRAGGSGERQRPALRAQQSPTGRAALRRDGSGPGGAGARARRPARDDRASARDALTEQLRDTSGVAARSSTAKSAQESLLWGFHHLLRNRAALERLRTASWRPGSASTSRRSFAKRSALSRRAPGSSRIVVGEPFELLRALAPGGHRDQRVAWRPESPPRPLPGCRRVPPGALPRSGGGTSSWLVFSAGTRRCLGATFSPFELEIVFSRIVQRTDLVAVGRPEGSARAGLSPAQRRQSLPRRGSGDSARPTGANSMTAVSPPGLHARSLQRLAFNALRPRSSGRVGGATETSWDSTRGRRS